MGVLLLAAGLLVLASAPAALGADRVYWGNDNDTISYANLDGSGGGQLNVSGATPSRPRGVAIDPAAGRIYWANQENHTISYANLDGSGGGGLLNLSGATPSDPRFVALLRAPSGAGAPATSAGDQLEDGLSCTRGEWAPNLLGEFLYRAPRSFAYQWLLDGANVPGANKATFTPVESGSYACRVTASNHAGSGAQTSAAHPVEFAHEFGFGDVKQLKRKGKARIKVYVPFAGMVELAGAGNGTAASASAAKVKPRRKSANAPGTVKLNVTPQGKKKRKLRRKGKAKVRVEATFSSGGSALATKNTRIKLKQKPG